MIRDERVGAEVEPAPAAATSGSTPPSAGTLRAPISSDTLLAGASEVQIAHRGAIYRLKQTALGKLILTK